MHRIPRSCREVRNQQLLGAEMKPLPLLAAIASLVAVIQPIAAQQKSSAATEGGAAANELTEVIITGTRRVDRTAQESSAPIDVLSGTDLASQATTNMLDTLSSAVPSFIVGQNSISDASSFVRSPSLRGLPGD
jgi:iron complex outermembrane receptor protein